MIEKNIIFWLKDLRLNDIDKVGGKNASLGEMIHHLSVAGIKVPIGFAISADAYKNFLSKNDLDHKIYRMLESLDVKNVQKLQESGKQIRQWILDAHLPGSLILSVQSAYKNLIKMLDEPLSVAVRSSATAEDLPNASFAGQQETYLNIVGFDNLILAIKKVYASLYTDRAIVYRTEHGYPHHLISLSVGIQQMVRSDLASSGIIFTIDTESGFDKTVLITSGYGLGELIVQGKINPDEFYVYKPSLLSNHSAIIKKQLGSKRQKMLVSQSDENVEIVPVSMEDQKKFSITDREVEILARQAMLIEQHYGHPMDIEWAKDGVNHELYIVQARPETVKSRENSNHVIERYILKSKGSLLVKGSGVGQKIGQGIAKNIQNLNQMHEFESGNVLVTDMTNPDWEPILKRASAIVTNRGGRTCHAAIVARELGIPAVVGCSEATRLISNGMNVTVSCAEGDLGNVYEGLLKFEVERINVKSMPNPPVEIMINVGNPDYAFDLQRLPNRGVGLARLEFIIAQNIGIHPRACLEFQSLEADLKHSILEKTMGYICPKAFYVDKLTEGIATLSAAFAPKPVIVRFSDFKTNEYANLLGGHLYEPEENNPMLGFRGASRYISENFKECFSLECEAIHRVRTEYNLTNLQIMIPFVRTTDEAKAVIDLLANHGLKRDENGLKIIMMCEVPSNAIIPKSFLKYFDGFSIGSNDLTQLTLGLDRDSEIIAKAFDERNDAVKSLIQQVIQVCKLENKYIGICGQGPSDHPDFAKWLIEQGIGSMSLNPDTVVATWLFLSKKS